MTGTGYHPEGHRLRPYSGGVPCSDPNHAHMICGTCAQVCPDPNNEMSMECVDDY